MDKVFKLPCISREPGLNKIYLCNKQIIFNLYLYIYWVDDCCYVGQVKSIVRISRSSSISWLELSKQQMLAANTSGSVLFLSCISLNIQTNNKGGKLGSLSCHHSPPQPNFTRQTGDCRFLNVEFWDQVQPIFKWLKSTTFKA